MNQPGLVLALSGGVGGAKLALGLQRIVAPGRLVVVANTGDDFEHLGLAISPDIDTLLYTLADCNDREQGWGRRDESWNAMESVGALGGPTWFRLGDRDLGLHLERTRRLRAGEPLSRITAAFARAFGLASHVVPMSDDPVRTRVETAGGWLDFQEYFVGRRCEPAISGIAFDGVERARPHPELLAALADPELRAVVICPSNPFISIEPILAVPGVRAALAACRAPVVAVAPIIGGAAVKGPTGKMLRELGLACSARAVAERYGALLDAYVVDAVDGDGCASLPFPVVSARALMETLADREALARVALDVADRVGRTAA